MAVKAVKFGSNTYLHRTGGINGFAGFPATSASGMISLWYNISLTAAQKKAMGQGKSLQLLSLRGVNSAGFGTGLFVAINSWPSTGSSYTYPYLSFSIINELVNAANSHSVSITWKSNPLTLNTSWHNAIIAWNTQAYGAGAAAAWVDGNQLTNPPLRLADIGGNALPGYPFSNEGFNCTGGAFSMEYNTTQAWAVGALIFDNQPTPSFVDSYYTGAMAELYLNAKPGNYVSDMANATNRDKFRAGGHAQDIGGISGFYPYGVCPQIYLWGGPTNFVRNIPDKIEPNGASLYNNQFTVKGNALATPATDPFQPGLIV